MEPNVIHGNQKKGYKYVGGRLIPKGYKLDDTNNPAKTPWTSISCWTGLAMAILGFFPDALAFVQAHPQVTLQGTAILVWILRTITRGAVTLSLGRKV